MILLLIDGLGAGGAQRQLVGLAIFLKEKGFDVSIACYSDQQFYLDQLLSKGVPYIYIKKASNKFTRLWHIGKYIQEVKPDWVISYLETPSICACIARIFNNKFKLIVSERNTTQQTGMNEKIRFNLFRVADYVIPNAFSQADYIKRTFPFLASKTVVIPNFVDLQYFTPAINRERRDVPEIMVAASIWASKNTLGFIDAIKQLKQKGYKFHISWYGLNTRWKDYIEECYQKINENGLFGYISLKEKTTDIQKCYQEADYFCLPSFYEGTSNVVCEAMACALPVACSNVCDNAMYVSEGINGFLFNPRDIDDMAGAIERMVNLSKMEYDSYCSNSRERAEMLLSKEIFIQSYLKIIKNK